VMFASRTMREWDATFIANVTRDGLLVWARGPLPEPLSAVEHASPRRGYYPSLLSVLNPIHHLSIDSPISSRYNRTVTYGT
jgi:hypothetical protein